MAGTNVEETTIDRLMELGTVTYEAAGWGTGEISIKCRSNTKCEEESLNKALIVLKAKENEVNEKNLEAYVVKKYNIAKRKFKAWKNNYKNENRSE